jgi:hypothetical protein
VEDEVLAEGEGEHELLEGELPPVKPVKKVKEKIKYQRKRIPNHTSKYVALLEREEKEEDDAEEAKEEAKSQFVSASRPDALASHRVHFWVLVMKGRRDMTEHVYVEPTTGQVWPVADAPYLGVESIWNEQNYW